MRDGAKSWIIKGFFLGLLTLATLGLVLMDMGGFFRDGAPTTIAFEIEGQEFTTLELDRLVTNELRARGLTLAQGLEQDVVEDVIEREIQSRLLLFEARDLGLRVSDEVVAQRVRNMVDELLGDNKALVGVDNSMVEKAVFQQYLQNMGLSEGQFVQYQKGQIASGLISNALFKGDFKPDLLTQNLIAYSKETRDADIYRVRISDKDVPKPSQDELNAFYDTNKELYRTDELRSFSMVTLTLDNIMSDLALGDDLLLEEYETRKGYGDYTTKASRLLSQASLGTKEEAEDVFKLAKSGTNLREAVKKVTGGTAAYITADRYSKGDLPIDLEDEIYSVTKKGILGPIETKLGWFVIDLQDITQEKTKPFADVKDEIAKDLKEQKAADLLFETAYAMEDMLAGGATLEEAATEMNAKIKRYIDVNREAQIIGSKEKNNKIFDEDDVTGADKVLDAVFETEEGLTTPLIENSKGDFIIAFVDAVKASEIPAYKAVEKRVKDDWFEDKKQQLAREKAEALMIAYEKDKKSLSFKTYKAIPRLTSLGRENKSALDDLEVSALFQLSDIGEMTSLPDKDGQVILKLNKINVPSVDLSKTSFIEQKGSIARSFKNDVAEDYFRALRDKMDIEIHQKSIALFYKNRIEQNY